MLSAVFSIPSLAAAVAESPSEVVVFDIAVLQRWFGSSHSFRDFILKSMATRIANMVGLVEQVTFEGIDSRLANFLLQRYSEKRIPLNVIAKTHGEIADELGTAREVVSRRLKKFERKGVIATGRGRVELLDTAFLTKMQGGSGDQFCEISEVCD
jgi:CRP/FNR family transcriptional regulator